MNVSSPQRRASLVFAAAVAFWAVVLGVRLSQHGWDMRSLLYIGWLQRALPLLADAPNQTPVGYDGQFYAELATDPFLLRGETVRSLDWPHYRATRIGLPLVAWILSAGYAPAGLVLYQLLCWVLGVGLVWIVARWLADGGRSPLWALPIAACAGLASSMIRCTVDAPAATLICSAFWLRSRGPRLPLLLAALACLTRETALVGALALAVREARDRRWVWAAAFALVPAALIGAWHLYLRLALPGPWSAPPAFGGLPFDWVLAKLGGPLPLHEKLGLLALLSSVAGAAALIRRHGPLGAPETAYLGFLALASLLSVTVYEDVWAYARALLPLPVLAVPLAEGESRPWRRWLLRGVTWTHAVVGLRMV